MRKVLATLSAVAMVIGLAATLRAEPKTVKGELIDVMCHAKKAENVGPGHADCALSCAKRGAALGILAPDGVYTITGDYTNDKNAKLLEFIAKNVEATGEIGEKDGAKTINVTAIKGAM